MITLLYGPDSYRRNKKKSELIKEATKKNLTLERIDLEDGEFTSVITFLRSSSLFPEHKFLVIDHISKISAKELKENLLPFADNKDVQIVISEDAKPPKKLDFLLKAPIENIKFDKLKGADWKAFVKKEAKEAGLTATAEAMSLLGSAYEGDSWGLRTEMDKLSLIGKEITGKDLKNFGIETAPAYWPLMQGLKSQSIAGRLLSLEKILFEGDPAAKTFNILAALWKDRAHRFASYDKAVKMGKIEYEEALLDAVL